MKFFFICPYFVTLSCSYYVPNRSRQQYMGRKIENYQRLLEKQGDATKNPKMLISFASHGRVLKGSSITSPTAFNGRVPKTSSGSSPTSGIFIGKKRPVEQHKDRLPRTPRPSKKSCEGSSAVKQNTSVGAAYLEQFISDEDDGT